MAKASGSDLKYTYFGNWWLIREANKSISDVSQGHYKEILCQAATQILFGFFWIQSLQLGYFSQG